MAKMCKCGRDFVLNNKGCCQDCYQQIMRDYNDGLFNASQHSIDLEPIQQPTHTYTAAAAGKVPSARTGAGGAS